MQTVLWLLFCLGLLGTFDTLYYHEWRARLPGMGKAARAELTLHAIRDFLYAPLFVTLPFVQWLGWMSVALAMLLISEIVITIRDFIVEDWVRKPLGGVFPGERTTHAVMGINYGAMLAFLLPIMWVWFAAGSQFQVSSVPVPPWLRAALFVLGIGVAISGLRDLASAFEVPYSAWPWEHRWQDQNRG